jgi:hypothetical protein
VFEDEGKTLGETDLRILSRDQEKRRRPDNLQEKSQAQTAPGSKEVTLEWHGSQELICRERNGLKSR